MRPQSAFLPWEAEACLAFLLYVIQQLVYIALAALAILYLFLLMAYKLLGDRIWPLYPRKHWHSPCAPCLPLSQGVLCQQRWMALAGSSSRSISGILEVLGSCYDKENFFWRHCLSLSQQIGSLLQALQPLQVTQDHPLPSPLAPRVTGAPTGQSCLGAGQGHHVPFSAPGSPFLSPKEA